MRVFTPLQCFIYVVILYVVYIYVYIRFIRFKKLYVVYIHSKRAIADKSLRRIFVIGIVDGRGRAGMWRRRRTKHDKYTRTPEHTHTPLNTKPK